MPQIEVTFDIDANGILDVRAKDRATGKEQQVRITASSMLSKDDVDKMVREASEHADEDRQRREEVETRNQAEQLTYQAERTVKDLGDKVSSEDKAEIENQVSSLREALKGSDISAITAGATALAETLNRVSTAAYQASGAEGGSDGTNGAGAEGEGEGSPEAEGEGEPAGLRRAAPARRPWRASSRRSDLLPPIADSAGQAAGASLSRFGAARRSLVPTAQQATGGASQEEVLSPFWGRRPNGAPGATNDRRMRPGRSLVTCGVRRGLSDGKAPPPQPRGLPAPPRAAARAPLGPRRW